MTLTVPLVLIRQRLFDGENTYRTSFACERADEKTTASAIATTGRDGLIFQLMIH